MINNSDDVCERPNNGQLFLNWREKEIPDTVVATKGVNHRGSGDKLADDSTRPPQPYSVGQDVSSWWICVK